MHSETHFNWRDLKVQVGQFSAIVTLEMVLEDLSNFTKKAWLETVKNRSAQLSKITFGCVCNGWSFLCNETR